MLRWTRGVATGVRRMHDSGPWVRGPELGFAAGRQSTISGVVFSKDRPLQLDGLLRSYMAHAKVPAPLTVIYSSTTEGFGKAYVEVEALHAGGPARFLSEQDLGGFREALVSVLEGTNSSSVFFLVDDIVFTDPVDLGLLAWVAQAGMVPSMRLGLNLSRSYTLSRSQVLPPMKRLRLKLPDQAAELRVSDLVAWRWRSGELDWGYPLSVDGNVFKTAEIRACIESVRFSAPNSLEDALQSHLPRYARRWGVCYRKSRLVNIPMNRVQDEVANLHGDVHQDLLLELWNRGMALDTEALRGFRSMSAHQDIQVDLVQRQM
jgi:hypothetical protein